MSQKRSQAVFLGKGWVILYDSSKKAGLLEGILMDTVFNSLGKRELSEATPEWRDLHLQTKMDLKNPRKLSENRFEMAFQAQLNH